MGNRLVESGEIERPLMRAAHPSVAATYGETFEDPSPSTQLAGALPKPVDESGAARLGRGSPYNRLLFVEASRSTDVIIAMLVLGTTYLGVNAGSMSRGWEEFLLLRLNVLNLLQLGAFALLWQQIFLLFGLYEKDRAPRWREEAPRVVAACTLGGAASLSFAVLSESGAFSALIPLLAWPPTVLATLATRYVLRKVAARGQDGDPRRVLIVGSGPLAQQLYLQVADRELAGECELVGFVDSNPNIRYPQIRTRIVGTLEQLENILMHRVVDEVLVALPIKSHYSQIQRVIEDCEQAGVQSRYSADVFRTRIASARPDLSEREPGVALQVAPDGYRLLVKRMIDIAGAATGLLLAAPLFLVIAIAIKLTSPGPVFFAQERYGWRKRRFRMLKFRTMVTDADARLADLEVRNEAGGPVFKIRNDPRITRVGGILRRTSLDELPQLWNVLRGEMSLVGPRPLPVRDVGRFGEAWLMRRFSVMPGLTGLWQVSGRSSLGFDRWVALDLEYIDRWSIWLDLLILLRTVPAVLRARGAV